MWDQLMQNMIKGDFKSLARCISLVENNVPGYEEFLQLLPTRTTPIIGITGPPGAGKSTLTDALIEAYVKEEKKVAVICVDPSSPFNLGALLGDRIRMSDWYNHPAVFIRSLATRGSMGGLHPKIIEVTDIMKAAGFDIIIVETVGVGQSEIEIAGLADTTVVVLVPEAGDEVQTMKSGLMEIADIFVVNKAVIKTTASKKEGIKLLIEKIEASLQSQNNQLKNWLLAEKAYHLIKNKRMKEINKEELKNDIDKMEAGFNLYHFIEKYT
jgi:LAO/AO transport system kinase